MNNEPTGRRQRVYFAHCMADYNTQREVAAYGIIKAKLPDWEVVDPNAAELADEYQAWRSSSVFNSARPMLYWTDLVHSCDAVAFLWTYNEVTGEFTIGAGVAQEILAAKVFGKPIFEVHVQDDIAGMAAGIAISNVFDEVMTIEETRDLIAATKGE